MRGTFGRAGRILLAVFVVAAMMPLGATPVAAASNYYVSMGGSNGNAGTSASPWRTITYAMDRASSGDTIYARPGTYSAGEAFPIDFKPGVRLVSTTDAMSTTIQGDGSQRVITMAGPTAGTELRGFEITGGGPRDGSGLWIRRTNGGPLDGWPLIAENRFIRNDAGTNRGGAIFIRGDSDAVCAPLILDNEFGENEADDGGAIECFDYARPTVQGNNFGANVAEFLGGGIRVAGNSRLTLRDNIFFMNSTNVGSGGAVYSSTSSSVRMVFEDNMFIVNLTGGNGAALSLSNSDFVLRRNWIVGNDAFLGGGGLDLSFGGAECENNVWLNNEANADGGAAYAFQATLEANGDTFYGNTSTAWSGIAGSVAPATRGELYLRNCIFWNHGGQDVRGAERIDYSCTQDVTLAADWNTVGAGVIHSDPRFADVAMGDFMLESDSPCIDTGHASDFPTRDRQYTLRPQDGDANGTARCDMGAYEYPEPIVGQFAGDDRYDTAARIAREWFESAETVVLASGEDFPDALSASGLAGAHEAPLLLTRKDSLPDEVSDALDDLGTRTVVIVGGTAAVSAAVASALEAKGLTVTRVAGADRYATAAAVAMETRDVIGLDRVDWAFVARGDDYPDALALAPLSYFSGWEDEATPILLTRPGELPQVTQDALGDLDARVLRYAGGAAAVSAAVKTQADAIVAANYPGTWRSERWSGADRYETAAAVARGGIDDYYDDPDYVGIATGLNFPDALAGSAAAAASGREGVLLLTRQDSLPSATQGVLIEYDDVFLWAEIYGGPVAVSAAVRDAIGDAIGW